VFAARLLHSLIGDWDAAAQAGSNENLFHAPLASCASTMERAVELVHSRHSASVEFGVRVVACDAAHSNTWKVLGVALFDAANHEDGMRALRAAQRLSPWHYEHVYAYIESLRAVGQRRQALVVARSALRLLPNAISLRCRALIVQRELCDWRGLWENIRAVQHSYLSAIELKAPCLTPFDALGLVAIDGNSQGISPADLRKISDYFSKQRLYLVTKSRQANLVVLPPLAFTIHTLNLGIASSLLQDNKIARYLQPALRFLNSAARHLAIQVMCFGLRLQAGASHARGREQFASACGTFVSLDTADDATVAEAINGHNLHVLVDLDGWNDGARQGVFARRPVALQIHIINYAGSTGSAWIDGFLGDVIATPPELTPHFTEKLMLLPQTYQLFSHASDRNMPLVDASDILLPPLSDGGVEDLAPLRAVKFLCASSPFRIDPDTFDLWMEVCTLSHSFSALLHVMPFEIADVEISFVFFVYCSIRRWD
jgi:protein O-GlcNAc transferase